MSQKRDNSGKKRIALFGGTFDPIHLGHTHLAAAAVDQLNLDRVIFLPCHQSPHKLGASHASASQRLAMCQLATDAFDWAQVDDHDLRGAGPWYSWLTAEAMHRRFPDARLYWLMGTDQWQALPRWSRPDHLSDLVEFIVFTRGDAPSPRSGYRLHPIVGDHPASATEIRRTMRDRATTGLMTHWLHPAVADYITDQALYG
ncbi:MAG: nicotinate (nicotinamide) nucleotide adenylyltransferase [Verrucomicrobiae bacterium]|nr:nicotinate (nicotinamide) nucleotide adenylyltransferase [Verrucomicrobiae bacterium]NNJ41988.1 nicotinate (nicotinamide) nucleotide adenylyltransferase [Akkermansiaceae bacterium]